VTRTIRTGDLVRLLDDVFPDAKVREFRFIKMNGNKVVLAHEDEYQWETEADDIDWGEFSPP
jgi:hypothetical protein